VATNGPIIHLAGYIYIYELGEPWWNDIDREKLIIPPQLSDNSNSNHLLAKQEEISEGNDEFYLRGIFVHTSRQFFACHDILTTLG
jgi:hypothetical protein